MKKLLLAAAVVALAPMSAMAADGTITINGQVNSSTCQINGSTGPGNITVTLPTVTTHALAALNQTAGTKPFSIALTGCPTGPGNTTATAYFEPGPNVDTATGYLKNNGAATNVQVQLLNGDLDPIKLNMPQASQNSKAVTLTSGAGTLNYYAQYIATAAAGATAGSVATSVTYTMLYQ